MAHRRPIALDCRINDRHLCSLVHIRRRIHRMTPGMCMDLSCDCNNKNTRDLILLTHAWGDEGDDVKELTAHISLPLRWEFAVHVQVHLLSKTYQVHSHIPR